MKKRIIIGICGASGVIYAIRLLKALLSLPIDVSLVVSDSGKKVLFYETGCKKDNLKDFLIEMGVVFHKNANLKIFANDDFFAPFASGTFLFDATVIVPCSMKTLSSIACGFADTLISRFADVTLKEKRKLVIVPRETPLNIIHIENMLKVAKAGAVVLPPQPPFYLKSKSIENIIDGIVLKILDQINVEHSILKRWEGVK